MPDGPPLPSLAIHLGRTKTTTGEQDDIVYLTGRPVEALIAWLQAAKIDNGSVFRAIGRWGTVSRRAIDPQSVNAIIKQRVELAGLDRGEFSAHGLRSGYLTEAANRGIPFQRRWNSRDIGRCSRHRATTMTPRVGADGLHVCFDCGRGFSQITDSHLCDIPDSSLLYRRTPDPGRLPSSANPCSHASRCILAAAVLWPLRR